MTDELKQWEYDRGYEKGRADAIDEFAKRLIDYCVDYKPMYLNFLCVIEEIAEQLKEQKNDNDRRRNG